MSEQPSRDQILQHLRAALVLADEAGMVDVALAIDSAIVRIDPDDRVLRDSAERMWRLPD